MMVVVAVKEWNGIGCSTAPTCLPSTPGWLVGLSGILAPRRKRKKAGQNDELQVFPSMFGGGRLFGNYVSHNGDSSSNNSTKS